MCLIKSNPRSCTRWRQLRQPAMRQPNESRLEVAGTRNHNARESNRWSWIFIQGTGWSGTEQVSPLLNQLDSWGCFFLFEFVGGRDNRDNNPKTWKVPPSPKEHSHKIRFLVWLSRCLKITKNHTFGLATNNYTKEKTGQNKLYLWSFQKLNKTPPGT